MKMQKQFKREQRYFVVKVKDAKEYLDAHQLEKLAEIADTISEGREKDGIPAVECVVVESDWPEYESTWRAIEDRVTGAQPAPSFADAYQGAMEEVAIWKRRALEAEDLNRKFVAEINGPAYMGEPAQPALSQSAQGIKDDIISDLQTQFDTEGIAEYDSGDALIRLSDAIAAVEDNFALAQPAPKAVAYLDLGTGGYMDIGTDLTDEALAALPKGRHVLGIVGTYGVDGYVPAQPAPKGVDGWREGVESAARLIDQKAELYAIRFGRDDIGGLSFGQGPHAKIKMDHYTSMIELADEVRATLAAAPKPDGE